MTKTELTSVLASDRLQINPLNYFLWDFAGVDGLQTAIALFTPNISRIAPFQSLTTEFNQQPCSVLRLCENNFRVALSEETSFDQAVAALGLNVWVKPCPATILILPTDSGLKRLTEIATAKPIYTLKPFPCDRAVPARINGLAILAWHHRWQERLRLEIQTAAASVDTIQTAFSLVA
ncbi:MAG: hypothetical protein AAFQ89_06845 [Cyanobacteria bacterium J06626_18]